MPEYLQRDFTHKSLWVNLAQARWGAQTKIDQEEGHMKALYSRTQNRIKLGSGIGRTSFKLHVKVEFDREEELLVHKYNLRDSLVIDSQQPALFRNAIIAGLIFAIFSSLILFGFGLASLGYRSPISPIQLGGLGALVVFFLASFAYYQLRRKTIYLRDLIWGRTFKCRSVIDLVEKEAWMERVLSYIRQVIEASKNWGETEVKEIKALPPEEAKKAILPKMQIFAVDVS